MWGYGQGYGGDQSDLHTIGMIDMSNSVAATVRADNTSNVTPSDYQDIFRIRVGPGEFSAGISGRISCPKGYIAQITSTGPISISTTGTEAGIHAGSRIDYIYAGEETGNPTQLPTNVRDISAKIVCRKLNLNGSISAGVLRRLHTAGDLTQPVDVVSINAPTDNATCAHNYGILVGGTITQPINVDRVLYLAVISAADFAPGADVTIGRYVKGTIEATATNGNLRAVSIGRGSETFPSYHGMNGWDGVCGTDTDADPPLHHSRQDDQVR